MTKTEAIRQQLYDCGVDIIDNLDLHRKSIVSPDGIIGLSSSICGSAEEHCVLAHDKAHLQLGGFYDTTSPYQLKSQIEYRVNKRVYMEIVPPSELKRYLLNGYSTEEIAANLEITEEVLTAAIALYKDLGIM